MIRRLLRHVVARVFDWAYTAHLEEDFGEFIRRETEAAIEGGIIDENTGLPFEPREE